MPAIDQLTQSDPSIEGFEEHEWDLMRSLVATLNPIYLATKQIESRECCISMFVPIVKTVLENLEELGEGQLTLFKQMISRGLKHRMAESEWEEWFSRCKVTRKIIEVPGAKRNKYYINILKLF